MPDPVRLDPYQLIVNVHWPEEDDDGNGLPPAYVQLRARIVFTGSDGIALGCSGGAEPMSGAWYAGSINAINWAVDNSPDGSLFAQSRSLVLDANGAIAISSDLVTISGAVAMPHKVGVGPWVYEAGMVRQYRGAAIGTLSASDAQTYSGTPLSSPSFASTYVAEQLQLRGRFSELIGGPECLNFIYYIYPSATAQQYALAQGPGAALVEDAFWNPLTGVSVTYDGQVCIFVGSFCEKISLGPPQGYHDYRALFAIPGA